MLGFFPLGQNTIDVKAINALINGELAKRTRIHEKMHQLKT
jgi:hypothetical protein